MSLFGFKFNNLGKNKVTPHPQTSSVRSSLASTVTSSSPGTPHKASINGDVAEAPSKIKESKKVESLRTLVTEYEQLVLGFETVRKDLEDKTKQLKTKAQAKTANSRELLELEKEIARFVTQYFDRLTNKLVFAIELALGNSKDHHSVADSKAIATLKAKFEQLHTEKNMSKWERQTKALQENIHKLYLPITKDPYNNKQNFTYRSAPAFVHG